MGQGATTISICGNRVLLEQVVGVTFPGALHTAISLFALNLTEEQKTSGVIRFSGVGETKYPGWRRWAKARLHRLTKQGLDDDALGAD